MDGPLAILLLAFILVVAGTISMIVAVVYERLMHRHRQPGVSYAQATFRRDGGWKRDDLFQPEGLRFQRKASRFGVMGALCWIVGLIALWVVRMASC
jgi:hypothetical protein